MSNIVARSIFHTTVAESNWKTKVTSAVVHVVVIGVAFIITVPVVEQLQHPTEGHVVLVSPYIPHIHPIIEPPHVRHVAKLSAPTPVPVDKPQPVLIAKSIPTPVLRAQPKSEPVLKLQPKIEAESKPSLPAPKPVPSLDVQVAKAAPVPKQVIVGGFGDPRGVHTSDTPKPQPVLMARVGAFDSPTGAGQTGGGGRLDSGAVKQSGFGSAGVPGSTNGSGKTASVQTGNFGESGNGTAHGASGGVRTTGFGDSIAAAPQPRVAQTSTPAFTPVEILFKPRPSYSAEAREMRLEGQVSMEVVFQASGAVRVVRIIKGLGHGLDEAAQQAALQVRFKPATRSGAAVDTNATISISFELS